MLSLEGLLTGARGFALPATPLQRAVCRVIDGRPLGDLADRAEVIRALGGRAAIEALPVGRRPTEVYLVAGIRGAKSTIAAAAAVLASQTVDLSKLSPGDLVRVAVVSLTVDTARVVYQHVLGHLTASPLLRQLLAGQPTADSIPLRAPCGRTVEIKIVAGARAGGTLVARWLAGAIFDEAPRMAGTDSVVNFADSRAAVLGRLLPGAQLLAIGSPWQDSGPVYDAVRDSFGVPTNSRVVIRAPAYDLNPVWWTPERVEEFRERHPELYRTDIEAEFGVASGAAFLSAQDLDSLFSPAAVEPPQPGEEVAAAVDLGFVRNSAALVVLARNSSGTRVVALEELRPAAGRSLVPSEVCERFAEILRAHRVRSAVADGHYRETLREYAEPVGVSLYGGAPPGERFLALRALLRSGGLVCSAQHAGAERLREQLRSVRPRLAPGGTLSVSIPEAPDGSHGDLADALAQAVWGLQRYGGEVIPVPRETPIEEERLLRSLAMAARRR